jgi:hypothetical protein
LRALADTKSENIVSILSEAIEFIEHALEQGGKVLVHCHQVGTGEPYLMADHGLGQLAFLART